MERTLAALLALTLCACASAPGTPASPTATPPSQASAPPPRSDLSMEPLEVAFREELDSARRRGLPLLIQERAYENGTFRVKFYNATGEVIDELVFLLQPYDALGRPAGSPASVRFRGPVRPSLSFAGDLLEGAQEQAWPRAGVDCVEITGLRLNLTGQATRSYAFDSVSRMYREGVDKWCRFAD